MPRRRFQTGCLKIVGDQWCFYFYRDEVRDGVRARVKVSKRIGHMSLSKRQARKLAQPILYGANNPGEGKPFFFTPPQVKRILAHFAGRKTWDAFFTLLALSGLRASEILRLRVEDLDFDSSTIHVRQGIWHGQVVTTKTDESENSVPMTPTMKAKLQEHLVNHPHELVFVNRRNRPFSRNKVVQTVLQPALDKLGVNRKGSRVGLHAFRHTLASMLLQSTGVAVAQRQLRHADASTTLGHYGHILGNDHREAVETIESVLSEPSNAD